MNEIQMKIVEPASVFLKENQQAGNKNQESRDKNPTNECGPQCTKKINVKYQSPNDKTCPSFFDG
jgi:hypothetical protein